MSKGSEMAKRDQLITILGSLPFFSGLSGGEILTLFKICAKMSFDKDFELFVQGEPSSDIYIFIKGGLDVYIGNTRVAEIYNSTTMGEIGSFLDQPRNATIKVNTLSHFLILPVDQLKKTLNSNLSLGNKILKNIAKMISKKIAENNNYYGRLSGNFERLNKELDLLLCMEPKVKAGGVPTDLKDLPEGTRAYLTFFNVKGKCKILKVGRYNLIHEHDEKKVLKLFERVDGILFISGRRPIKFEGIVSRQTSKDSDLKIRMIDDEYKSFYSEI